MSEKQSVFTTTIRDEGRVFAENEIAFAFPTNIPITPGHSLIVPKRVVETLDELTEDEVLGIFQLTVAIKGALKKAVGAKGFNYAWNEGIDFGQSVPHFHLHIVPRTENDNGITEYEPREFLYRPGSRIESPAQELLEVADLIKEYLPSEFRTHENH